MTTALAKLDESAKYGIMDVLDEELIRADLAGTDVDDLVYKFKIGDKEIEDLTSQGAIAMARLAVQSMPVSILCDKPVTEEREKAWKASVKVSYVTEKGNRFEFWGTFVQPKDIINEEGKFVRHDEKAEQISEVKATRNGILKIFPRKARVSFMEQFRKEGKIKEISSSQVADAAAKAEKRGYEIVSPKAELEVSKLISSLRWVMNKNEPDREFAFASEPIGHIKDEVKPLLSAIESAKGKLVLLEKDGMSFAYTYDAKSERVYRQPVSALDSQEASQD